MSIDFLLTIPIFLTILIAMLRQQRRIVALETAVVATRRQVVANRKATPAERPTKRNREVMKLGRDIDAEVPVNEDLQILDNLSDIVSD